METDLNLGAGYYNRDHKPTTVTSIQNEKIRQAELKKAEEYLEN